MGTLFLVCKKCEILEDAATSLIGKVFAHGCSPVRLWVYWISEFKLVIPPTYSPTHSLCLAGSKVAQQDSGAERERVHVLCRSGKHLPSPHHVGTLCLCLTGGLEDSSQIV